MESIIAILNL